MSAIAILGAGRLGTALEALFRRTGSTVAVSPNRESNAAALTGAEIVVLAVPWTKLADLAERCAPLMSGKILVDATNPFSASGEVLEPAAAFGSGGAQNAARFEGARTVKAFNTLAVDDLAARGTPVPRARVALAISGDDYGAKQIVAGVVEACGYEPVDVGSMASASVQEPGGSYYGRILTGAEMRNGELARRFVELVLGRGDTEAFEALVAEEIVVTSGISPLAPMVGKAAFAAGLAALAAFSDGEMHLEDVLPAGDRVTVRYTAHARHTGDQLGVPATGKRITMREMRLMRFAGGRIVEDFVADINYDWPWLVAPAYRDAWLARLS